VDLPPASEDQTAERRSDWPFTWTSLRPFANCLDRPATDQRWQKEHATGWPKRSLATATSARNTARTAYSSLPWQCLYRFPDPQGQRLFCGG